MATNGPNTAKLKDPGVCRIFMSSPFNGLEEERELLTKHYWPRVQSLCASRGVQMHLVDMRWGITEEAGKLAQTALICLKELDRSDIFVGFFGQVVSSTVALHNPDGIIISVYLPAIRAVN